MLAGYIGLPSLVGLKWLPLLLLEMAFYLSRPGEARSFAEAQRGGDTERAIMRFTDSQMLKPMASPSQTTQSTLLESPLYPKVLAPRKDFSYHDQGLPKPPVGYQDGPMPILSDSVFSLIILVYVSVIFIFMFFAFCWREPEPPPPDPAHKNIPMITSILDEMEKQQVMEDNGQRDDQDGRETTQSEGDSDEMADHPLIDVSNASDLPSTNNSGLLQLPLVSVSVHQETANS